jgi:hypothetical protein
MAKAVKGLLYHLGSALGARDSRNRVSWLSAHLLDFPAHEAYRKELKRRQTQPEYNLSSTLSLVRKWGPSTRNILRSMASAALGVADPIEGETTTAAIDVCSDPVAESFRQHMPQSKSSSIIFLRRTQNGSVDKGKVFIPTPHLLAIFEEQRVLQSNEKALELFFVLSSHALTRAAAGWGHEQSMHARLVKGGEALRIFQAHATVHSRSSPPWHIGWPQEGRCQGLLLLATICDKLPGSRRCSW